SVHVQAGETVRVDYVRLGGDGVVYLLDTCTDTTTAVACDDNDFAIPGVDAPERLSWTNATPGPVELVLVLDTWTSGSITAPFFLDVVIE
ncbi:MAG: hypothetical protein KC656_36120, partial [Myxococcales bacterium]|nr:hypothetical protein [Myxococcales bacterium]